MIPGEIPGWRSFVGQRYWSERFGKWVRFAARDYQRVGNFQIPWPDNLLVNVYPDLPEAGHPLTLYCLRRAWQMMANRVVNYAAARGVPYTLGRIHTTGLFRPPGETWGEGAFRDPHGVIDSTDNFGHWHMAVDISIEQTRCSFTPHLRPGSVLKALLDAGLIRPFGVEPWHFRPKRRVRRAFYKEQPTYEMA